MRIAFDHQAFCLQKTGGISRYYCRLAEELSRHTGHLNTGSEHDVDVSIFAPLYRNQYLRQMSRNIVRGYPVSNYLPKTAEISVAANGLLAKQLMKHWHPDVVHETYFSATPTAPQSCPTVLTVFDMISELAESESGHTISHFKSSSKYVAVKRAEHIICISEQTRRDLINLFEVSEKKVSVVYLGCDVVTADATKETANEATKKAMYLTLENYRDDNRRPYLLYVGLRDGYKNFDKFIRAIANSPRLKPTFDVIAFGGGVFNGHEQALFKELGLDYDQIRQQGGSDEVLNALYKNAAAFVYPSTYEGFGLPPLEAMAQQCPVVSSYSSSMPEVIGDAAQYFDPNSVESMTFAIEAVVFSTARVQELVELGNERIKIFSWQRCAENTLAVYRSLLRLQ
jgi:glycosyltransferase involved in cell wall biosynthesis